MSAFAVGPAVCRFSFGGAVSGADGVSWFPGSVPIDVPVGTALSSRDSVASALALEASTGPKMSTEEIWPVSRVAAAAYVGVVPADMVEASRGASGIGTVPLAPSEWSGSAFPLPPIVLSLASAPATGTGTDAGTGIATAAAKPLRTAPLFCSANFFAATLSLPAPAMALPAASRSAVDRIFCRASGPGEPTEAAANRAWNPLTSGVDRLSGIPSLPGAFAVAVTCAVTPEVQSAVTLPARMRKDERELMMGAGVHQWPTTT